MGELIATHCREAFAYAAQGKWHEAILSSRRALRLDKDVRQVRYCLAICFHRIGQTEKSIVEFERAVAGRPFLSEWCEQYGDVLFGLCRWEPALDQYERCIRHHGRNSSCDLLRRAAEAAGRAGEIAKQIRYWRRILKGDGGRSPDALNGLAMALLKGGSRAAALHLLEEAAAQAECGPEIQSNALLCSLYTPGQTRKSIYERHLAWGETQVRSKTENRRTTRPLSVGTEFRVGYVGPSYQNHSIGFFLRSILGDEGAAKGAAFYYSTSGVESRSSNGATKEAAWRNIGGMRDYDVARQVVKDRIDILIDVAGHSAGNRLSLFALQPVAVQCTFLGYPATTGLREIQYRITDCVADPPGTTEQFHTEELARIDPCFLCYSPPKDSPRVTRRRGEAIVFGCFGGVHKMNGQTFRLWAKILREVPGSRLMLKGAGLSDPGVQRKIGRRFELAGVEVTRLRFCGMTDTRERHLSMYGEIDIALDTFPYNGTTTTCESLWMGVPVVTLAGSSHVSRTGATILGNVGLTDWITWSETEYIYAATHMARAKELGSLRSVLRGTIARSILMDSSGYSARVNRLFRNLLEKSSKPMAAAIRAETRA